MAERDRSAWNQYLSERVLMDMKRHLGRVTEHVTEPKESRHLYNVYGMLQKGGDSWLMNQL